MCCGRNGSTAGDTRCYKVCVSLLSGRSRNSRDPVTNAAPWEYIRAPHPSHAAVEAMEQAAQTLLTVMETCHVCRGTVLVEEGAVNCEDCSACCDDHEEPECPTLYDLHLDLNVNLPPTVPRRTRTCAHERAADIIQRANGPRDPQRAQDTDAAGCEGCCRHRRAQAIRCLPLRSARRPAVGKGGDLDLVPQGSEWQDGRWPTEVPLPATRQPVNLSMSHRSSANSLSVRCYAEPEMVWRYKTAPLHAALGQPHHAGDHRSARAAGAGDQQH